MPKRTLIKLIALSLATLGTVFLCTALSAGESARLRAAGTPGVPGTLIAAAFVVYPLLCAAGGLACGKEGRRLCLLPGGIAFVISAALGELAAVVAYGAVGYLFFFVSRLLIGARGTGKEPGVNVRPGDAVKDIAAALSSDWGLLLAVAGYVLLSCLLLCPLDAVEGLALYFTVPILLFLYPPVFIIAGAAAGKCPKKLWPVPLAAAAVLFIVANCTGGSFALSWYGDIGYYLKNCVVILVVYVALGYFAMLFSYLFFWKRDNLYVPRMWAVLSILGTGPLIYGASHIPGYCWGHPFWGEALWYVLLLGLAVIVGVLSGRNIRRFYLMPLAAFLASLMAFEPPVYHFGARLPEGLGRAWWEVCFFVGVGCMIVSFFVTKRNKRA